MLPEGRQVQAVLRRSGYVVRVICAVLCAGPQPAWALPAATTTTLVVTSAGNAATTSASGSVVTLTATVTAGGNPVNPGQINFCDATAKYCTDIHLLGTAQLTSTGTATLKFRPGIGSHSYKAIFVGTTGKTGSASAASALTVTGLDPTVTTIAVSGSPGAYSLTATVSGNGIVSPTSSVSFLDTNNSNQSLAMSPLVPGTAGLNLLAFTVPNLNSPQSFAVGDFNGDGIPDLAVASGDILVMLGNGDGSFRSGVESPANVSFNAFLAVGDFNGDGKTDLAVASYGLTGVPGNAPSVAILLSNGDGTFTQAAANLGTGDTPGSLTTGDFNGDGNLDLAVANAGSNTLTILLGNGDGTFTAAASPATGNSPSSVAVGDFNGDGKPDLAVTNAASNTVSILLGHGDGTFTAAASPATNSNPLSVAVGDFNGDGNADLAVANEAGNTITILLGNGDGTFTAASNLAIVGPNSIAVGDFNGDGIADLAVGGRGAAVLLGNGDGTFTASATLSTFTIAPQAVVAADFNGDGRTDVADSTVNGDADAGSITVLLSESQFATAVVNNLGVSSAGVDLPTHLVDASYSGDAAYSGSISAGTIGLVGQVPFTLSGTNLNPAVPPGSSSNSTVTVAAVAGFTGAVALSCSVDDVAGATSPLTCSIAPSVTISRASTATETLTITTTAGASTGQYMVTVAGTSGESTETITYRVSVPFGVFTLADSAVSVAAGSSGNSTVTITPITSFTGSVTLKCAVTSMPSGGIFVPTCSVPQPVAIAGTAVATASVAISTQLSTTTGDYVVTVTGSSASATKPGTTVTAAVPVTVTAGPNFMLSSTAVSIASPGASGTSTITVTPSNGFTGSVTLICNQVAEGINQPKCSAPGPVAVSGTAPVAVSITVSTDAATAGGNYTVEVDSKSLPGSLKSTFIPVTVNAMPSFALSNTAVNIASPGASGTSTITIAPSGGFTGNVALSCTVTGPAGAIDPPTCMLPAQTVITSAGTVTAALTVYTTATAAASTPTTGYSAKVDKPLKRIFTLGGSVAISALLLFGIPARRRPWKKLLSLLLFASIAGAVIGCGGATNAAKTPANPGTTLGTYTVTVTGTSAATVQSTAVTVTVN